MNELFDKIEKDSDLNGRVKMIGIAAGNDKHEIALDFKNYKFPIIPDDDYAFHNIVNRPPTPFLIFARPYDRSRLLVLDSHLGRLEDSDKLLAMTKRAFEKFPEPGETLKRQQITGVPEDLTIPISEKEVMAMVGQSMAVKGDTVNEIRKIESPELKDMYTGILKKSGRRVFARVVGRKIPCIDCHDVFYVYSFDEKGKFMKFIPIAVYKLDNEEWDKEDISKIRKNLKGRSLLKELNFNPDVDAITSATISSKLIYDGMGETKQIIQKLEELGYIPS